MNPRRLLPTLLPLAVLVPLAIGCGDKDPTDDTGQPTTDGGTEDGGTETDPDPVWTEVSIETSQSITGIYAAGADEAWITMTDGQTKIWQTGSWSTLSIDVDDEDLNGIWGTGSGSGATVVAVGDAGYIAEWGASGWDLSDVGTANFEAVDGASSSALFAAGWGGLYDNSSGDWTYVNIAGNPRFNHVWYDGVTAAAVGEDGVLAVYTGGEWTVTQEDERRSLYGVSGTGINDIYAVGEAGTVLHYNGTVWEDFSPETGKSIWAVWAANTENVYVVGNGGLALLRTGGEWVELPTGAESNLYAVHGTGVNDVWAVGGQGLALRYQP